MCSSEITTSSSSNKSIVWPMAFPDSSVTKPCFSGAGNVSRTCKKFGNEVPRWEPIDPKACKTIEEKRSEALDALLKVKTRLPHHIVILAATIDALSEFHIPECIFVISLAIYIH